MAGDVGKTLLFTILGVDKASPAFKKLAKSADETSKKLGSFGATSGKIFAGFAGGALASGAAIVGSIAAIGTATAVTAAVILHNNDKISTAATSLWTDLQQQARQGAAPLAQPITDAINKVHGTILDLGPQIGQLFEAGAPAVEHFAGGIDKLARGAFPGLVTAAQSSEVAFAGIESLMGDLGQGIGDFFTNASRGAESAGSIIATTGRIIRDFAGFAGSLFTQLSDSGAPAIQTLENFLSHLETTILSLGQGAFPILSTGASGFLLVGSALLNILNGVAPILGPLIGQVVTFGIVLKGIDTVTFGGVGRSFEVFKDGISKAGTFAEKVKTGVSGLVTSGLGPLGIVAGVAGIALEALGAKSQETAKRQQSLTDAFRESKGAIDDNVRATVAKNLSDEGLLQKGKDIGVTANVMTDAWLGNSDAVAAVTSATNKYTAELEGQGQMEGQVAQGSDALSTKANDVATALKDQGDEAANSAASGKLYAEAMSKGAVGTDGLTQASKEAADALQKLQDKLDAMVSKDLAYRNAVDSTQQAQGKLADTQKAAADALKNHGQKSKEFAAAQGDVADASRGLEGAYISQAAAARDLGQANSIATDDIGRTRDGAVAYTQEVLNMATAAGSNAPRALQMMTANLKDTDLTALGATKKVNELGQTVITLPNGKTITVNANDEASGPIRAIAGAKYVAVVHLQADWSGFSRTVGQGSVLSGSSARGNAEGGWITGPGTGKSDSIPRMLSNGEFVVKASEAAKYAPLVEAINSGRMSNVATAMATLPIQGSASAGGGTSRLLINSSGAKIDDLLVAILRKSIRVQGGNVQVALGS